MNYAIANSKIYKKQRRRERELVKQLFETASREGASKTFHNEIKETAFLSKLSMKIWATSSGTSRTVYFSDKTIEITLNIEGAKQRTKIGYSDGYYKGRQELLAKYTLHNLHNEIRFLIYHELKHSLDAYNFSDYNSWPKRRREYTADCYALKQLKHSKRIAWNI